MRIDCMVFLILEKGEGETKKNIERSNIYEDLV